MILEATVGGIRRHVVDLLLGLDKEKYKTALIYSDMRADAGFNKAIPELTAHGVELHQVVMGRGIDIVEDFRAMLQIIRLLKKIRPNIIHAHGAKAGAVGRCAALLCGYRRIVYTPHGGAFHKFKGIRGHVYWIIEKCLGRISGSYYIGVSRYSCDQILRDLGAPAKKVYLVYNGIPPPALRWGSGAYGREHQSNFKILFPAVFFEAKGHLEFMDALSRSDSRLNSEIKIFLAGDGPLRQKIEEKIKSCDLGRQVLIMGFIEELGPWYQDCDLVILPSQAEVFGYAVLEAMHFGKPVIAADVGGLKEIIRENETGLFFSGKASADIAGVLNACARDTAVLSKIGHRAQEFARTNFSLKKMLAETAAVYEQISGNKP